MKPSFTIPLFLIALSAASAPAGEAVDETARVKAAAALPLRDAAGKIQSMRAFWSPAEMRPTP